MKHSVKDEPKNQNYQFLFCLVTQNLKNYKTIKLHAKFLQTLHIFTENFSYLLFIFSSLSKICKKIFFINIKLSFKKNSLNIQKTEVSEENLFLPYQINNFNSRSPIKKFSFPFLCFPFCSFGPREKRKLFKHIKNVVLFSFFIFFSQMVFCSFIKFYDIWAIFIIQKENRKSFFVDGKIEYCERQEET